MGEFTKWVEDQRGRNLTQLSQAAGEKLAREIQPAVKRALQRCLTRRFGLDVPKEMVQQQVAVFLKRLDKPELGIPASVVDSSTMYFWLFDECWSRYCKKFKTINKRRGESAVAELMKSSEKSLGLDVLSNNQINVNEAEEQEHVDAVMQAAFDDFDAWRCTERRGSSAQKEINWKDIFGQVCFGGRDQKDFVEQLGVSASTISRWLDRAKFCVGRRLGQSIQALKKAFPDAEKWTIELEAAISRSR